MDPIKILKRAWQILWSYKALWIFGIILALTTASGVPSSPGSHGGSSSDSSNSQGLTPRQAFSEAMQEMKEAWNEEIPQAMNLTQQDINTLIAIGIFALILMVLLGVVMTAARYVAETAVIRMVDDYETTGTKMSVRKGFRIGWSRTAWRLFLTNLLISLPIMAIVLLMLGVGVAMFLLISREQPALTITSSVVGIGIIFLCIFALIILGVAIRLLVEFFWRASALEQVGVIESIRRGWSMVRKNLSKVALMWLIMIGVRLAYGIFMVIAFFILLPVLALTIVAGILVGGLPGLLFAGISSIFLNGYWPWVVGALFALPFFTLVAFSPLIFLGSLERVFTSTVWTLTYRELKAAPVLATVEEPILPAEPAKPADEVFES